MFTLAVKTRINNSGITGMQAYAESMPAPTTTTPSNVAVIPSNEIHPGDKRDIFTATLRILVSGSAAGAKSKAQEIYDYFLPERTSKPGYNYISGFVMTEGGTKFIVKSVFCDRKPHHLRNSGNIFIAQFVLRFLVAYGD